MVMSFSGRVCVCVGGGGALGHLVIACVHRSPSSNLRCLQVVDRFAPLAPFTCEWKYDGERVQVPAASA